MSLCHGQSAHLLPVHSNCLPYGEAGNNVLLQEPEGKSQVGIGGCRLYAKQLTGSGPESRAAS